MPAIDAHAGAVRRHSAKVDGKFGRPRRIGSGGLIFLHLPNALVQLQAQYHHCGEAASEKCLSAATLVRQWRRGADALRLLWMQG